jgi:hypothetical protein
MGGVGSGASSDRSNSKLAMGGADAEWLGPGQFEQVRYLADEYMLFSVAIPLGVSTDNKDNNYVLSGLVQTKRFNAEAAALPVGWQAGIGLLLALILFGLVVAGVFSKGVRERLRNIDVLFLALSLLGLGMTLTMVVLAFQADYATDSFFDELMRGLAGTIEKNLKNELVASSGLLEKVESAPAQSDPAMRSIVLNKSAVDRSAAGRLQWNRQEDLVSETNPVPQRRRLSAIVLRSQGEAFTQRRKTRLLQKSTGQ